MWRIGKLSIVICCNFDDIITNLIESKNINEEFISSFFFLDLVLS